MTVLKNPMKKLDLHIFEILTWFVNYSPRVSVGSDVYFVQLALRGKKDT